MLQSDDGDILFITSSNHRQHEKRGVRSYQDGNRQKNGEDDDEDNDDQENQTKEQEELRDLRFTYHRTAFDIDMDELEEQTWRLPHTDVSDYFNFGFNEATWRVRQVLTIMLRVNLSDMFSAMFACHT